MGDSESDSRKGAVGGGTGKNGRHDRRDSFSMEGVPSEVVMGIAGALQNLQICLDQGAVLKGTDHEKLTEVFGGLMKHGVGTKGENMHGNKKNSESVSSEDDQAKRKKKKTKRKSTKREFNKENSDEIDEGLTEEKEKMDEKVFNRGGAPNPENRNLARSNELMSGNEGQREWLKDETAWRLEQRRCMKAIAEELSKVSSAMSSYMRVMRCVKPLPFEIEGIQSFDKFIVEFQSYAKDRVGPDPARWLIELRAHLGTHAKKAYDKCYRQGAQYRQVVTRLRDWVLGQRRDRSEEKRTEFYQCQLGSDETVADYALRIEALFRDAFSGDNESENTLLNRFMNTIPRDNKERIKLRLSIYRLDEGKRGEPEWKDLLKILLEDTMEDGTARSGNKENPDHQEINVWAVPGPGYGYQENMNRERKWYPDTARGPQVKTQQARSPPGQNWSNNNGSRYPANCEHCGKRGHGIRDCWNYHKRCLGCGSREHFLRNCDRNRYGNKSKPANRRCLICDSDRHLVRECSLLKERRQEVESKRRPVVARCLACESEDHLLGNCPVVERRKAEWEAWEAQNPRNVRDGAAAEPTGERRAQTSTGTEAQNANAFCREEGQNTNGFRREENPNANGFRRDDGHQQASNY